MIFAFRFCLFRIQDGVSLFIDNFVWTNGATLLTVISKATNVFLEFHYERALNLVFNSESLIFSFPNEQALGGSMVDSIYCGNEDETNQQFSVNKSPSLYFGWCLSMKKNQFVAKSENQSGRWPQCTELNWTSIEWMHCMRLPNEIRLKRTIIIFKLCAFVPFQLLFVRLLHQSKSTTSIIITRIPIDLRCH